MPFSTCAEAERYRRPTRRRNGGAAVGSAVGGRNGAIIGGGLGGAAGAAIATQPAKKETVKVEKQVIVEKEAVHVHHDDCWQPGHCKHKHKHHRHHH